MYATECRIAVSSSILGIATVIGFALLVVRHGNAPASGQEAVFTIFLAPVALFAVLALGGYLHRRSGWGLTLLWASWICLVIDSVITLWIWLIPALLLGLVAGIIGLKARSAEHVVRG